ncbi:BppU family phage baseplate upper protein [Bacillus sp. FDAARGOS_1420]|uniref:BppU family phage baseplate upper protein n=1 Tax=Bacillus sp. FDAARGOS_1420 TaxID=2856338 RepID=UPI001C5AAC51|nr:BppU family phage baseplate upper protein [Bacillus sp. FDAARGOS_1420]MBW3496614.1 phage baseplate upper protein [Bacillus sp. FDAARGOS_1420]
MKRSYEIIVDTRQENRMYDIEFSKNNLNTSELIINITEDEHQPFVLQDTDTIVIAFKKPDQTLVFQNKDIKILDKEKGKISVSLTTQTLAKTGTVFCEISIEREELGVKKRISTFPFSFKVRDSLLADDNMYTRIVGDRTLDILLPLRGNKVAHYTLRKDTKDDYVKLEDCAISNLSVVAQKVNAINYTSDTGAVQKANLPNYYTTTVGDTFTFTFDGTGFDFQHFTDNRGGLWEFKVDGTVVKTISTHINDVPTNELKVNYGTRSVARGLAKGTHTVVATFKGDDPANPPVGGANTSRGWVKNDTGYVQAAEAHKTALVYDDLLNPVKEVDLLVPFSNKEFAFCMKPNGSSVVAEWIPEHRAATVFKTSQKMYVDDKEITSWGPETTIKEAEIVRAVQSMKGFHPSDLTNALCEIYSVHTVTNQGVTFDIKIKWLQDTFIEDGYIAMLPGSHPFVEKLVDATGKSFDTIASDNSYKDVPNSEKMAGYAMPSKERDYVVAMKINNIHASLRKGQTGIRNPLVWLQHRDATLQKLYPQVYKNCVVKAGETHPFSATYFVGELPLAAQLLI